MARFVLAIFAILAIAVTIAPQIYAALKTDVVGHVFFLEGGKEDYIKRSSLRGLGEDDVFSREETAAAIAVLLGVPPPVMLSQTSSAKHFLDWRDVKGLLRLANAVNMHFETMEELDSVLSSNPFKRPHAVFSVTIRGVALALTPEEIDGILKLSSFEQRPFSVNGHQVPYELSGRDVTLQLLNGGDYEHTVEELETNLKALVKFLGGSYDQEEGTNVVLLKVPLPLADGFSISLDLKERADLKFAVDLFSLFHCMESASVLQGGPEGVQNLAKLFMGTYTAIELMDEESGRKQGATKLLMFTAIQVLGALQTAFDGQIVGVLAVSSSTSDTPVVPMFSTMEARLSRFLLDDALAPAPSSAISNQTLLDAEIQKLAGRSIALVVTLILIFATGLGSCFLFSMPLTRDTLLYASVKLD